MVRAVLVFGVEAVNAMFAGMMYGIPAYYAPGKKKDNHASAGTLRAYCQLFVVYTKYVRLSPTEGAAVRYAELPVTRFAKYCPRTLRPAVSDQGGTAEGLGQRAASRFAQRVT